MLQILAGLNMTKPPSCLHQTISRILDSPETSTLSPFGNFSDNPKREKKTESENAHVRSAPLRSLMEAIKTSNGQRHGRCPRHRLAGVKLTVLKLASAMIIGVVTIEYLYLCIVSIIIDHNLT